MALLDKLFPKEEPQTVEVKGKELICTHCSNDTFWQKKGQLNTAASSFFGLDWTNAEAHCFICSECTHISWFLGE